MKKLARRIVAAVLGFQVRQLYKKNNFKVIAVVGSIGKTSTKLAIAEVLSAGFRVRYQEGNYNDLVTVPLVFFDETMPSLLNPFAWAGVFWRNRQKLSQPYPYDIVVVELGSDAPGQIGEFSSYLKVEIGVITAITAEHMANFSDLDSVAGEELAVSRMAGLMFANRDLCADKYLKSLPNTMTYAIDNPADYRISAVPGGGAVIKAAAENIMELGEPPAYKAGLYSVLAAALVAYKLGMKTADIRKSVATIRPVPGRMQRLAGIKGSTIIDDSYNASPEAVKLALDSLYRMNSPQKIAVLGSMNELGRFSLQAHTDIGNYCDPRQLELVVTIGKDAKEILAKTAEAKGCRVQSFDSPYEAGEYLKSHIKQGGAVLVKGSQNGVFAEEAIKSILANPDDEARLVRQTPQWLQTKKKAFGR